MYYIYILASKKNGVLYVGVTNDLIRRTWEHKDDQVEGFSKKYFVKKLVYYKEFDNVYNAIEREKCIKRWKRDWKIKIIEKFNKSWEDLYNDISS